MATKNKWSDQYWPLIIKAWLQKPEGTKSKDSKTVVDIANELRIDQDVICEKMTLLDKHESPLLQKLWKMYAKNPRRLNRDIKNLRQLSGFGDAEMFYEGVETARPVARIFLPVTPDSRMTPAILILILHVYFTLTPNCMVESTPEIIELAQLTKTPVEEIVKFMKVFQCFDPILQREPPVLSPIIHEAREIWEKYYELPQSRFDKDVEKIKEYFNS